jgi:hypothetical protein
MPATIVLLYEQSGTQATCNLSVKNIKGTTVDDYDRAYFFSLLGEVFSDVKIRSFSKNRSPIGDSLLVESSGTMNLPQGSSIKVRTLVCAFPKDREVFIFILNAPNNTLDSIRDDFNSMINTFLKY